MISGIFKLGGWGGGGFLVGLGAVWWIEPTTGAGTALIIAIGIVLGMILGALISKPFKEAKPPEEL